jgi:protein gp37
MKNTAIEWCDHTFNPWEGCTKVSPGCAHCYAETRNARFGGGTAPNWGKGAPRSRTSVHNWNQVCKWNSEAGKLPPADGDQVREWHRPRVFCASLADWLDDEVPIEWLIDLLNLIRETPNLDWLLLTKRPQLWKWRVSMALLENFDAIHGESDGLQDWLCAWAAGKPPANVWIGTTVEDQQRADERIPDLLKIPARVRFLSCEPLLTHVNAMYHFANNPGQLHWVICGGESGPGARPMHPQWATSLRDQCAAAGVPFLFKQWGEWLPWGERNHYPDIERGNACDHTWADGEVSFRVGKKAAGRLLDGIEHNGFPA